MALDSGTLKRCAPNNSTSTILAGELSQESYRKEQTSIFPNEIISQEQLQLEAAAAA